jgi:hypothetical protein
MICHRNKLIFIHLPKCAGTSIEVAFTGGSWGQGELHREQHLTAVEAQELYGDDIFDSYFKFTIVRNPWDLLIAYYLWGCWGLRGRADTSLKGRLKRHLGRTKAWGHPFREEARGFTAHPTLKEYLDNSEHFNKELGFSSSATDLSQQLAAISIDGKLAVDHVGKFENLNDDLKEICKKVGMNVVQLPHRLKSNRSQHYSQFYSNEAREIVRNKYVTDIEAFNYVFEDIRGSRW